MGGGGGGEGEKDEGEGGEGEKEGEEEGRRRRGRGLIAAVPHYIVILLETQSEYSDQLCFSFPTTKAGRHTVVRV